MSEELVKFRELMQSLGKDLEYIVTHPEVINDWEPAQQVWMMEHLEMLIAELKRAKVDIEQLIADRTAEVDTGDQG